MHFEDADVIIPLISGQPGLGASFSIVKCIYTFWTNWYISSSGPLPENRSGIHALLLIILEAHEKNPTVIASSVFLQAVGIFQKTQKHHKFTANLE